MEGTGVFTKAVLRPGQHRSPNGVIDVTPDRLRHWESQFRAVQAAGYTIPMHWDHSADPKAMEPIRMGSVRSAANTVGKLRNFRVAPDGQSAELEVQTLTRSAREAAATNAVFVSPVLFSEWQDGAGRTYTDLIGSVEDFLFTSGSSSAVRIGHPGRSLATLARLRSDRIGQSGTIFCRRSHRVLVRSRTSTASSASPMTMKS